MSHIIKQRLNLMRNKTTFFFTCKFLNVTKQKRRSQIKVTIVVAGGEKREKPLLFFLEIMSQATTRLGQLTQLSCKIFSNVYNPSCARTGNKVLRQRLIGSSLTAYNPQKLVHFRDIQALYPQLGLVDLEEKERLDEIARRKRRGKGAPKKGKFE